MRHFLTLLLTLLAFAAGAQTSIHYDSTVNFARYKTFRCLPGKVSGQAGRKDIDPTALDRVVKSEVTAALRGKGMTYGGTAAGLTVTYIAGVRDMEQLQDLLTDSGMNPAGPYRPKEQPEGWYYAGGGPWETSSNNWWTIPYERETFILDLYDTRKKQLVWRCYAETDRDRYDEEAFVELLKNALEQFPPSQKQHK